MDPMGPKDVEKRDFSRKICYLKRNLADGIASPGLPAVPRASDISYNFRSSEFRLQYRSALNIAIHRTEVVRFSIL